MKDLIAELTKLLKGGSAHVSLKDATSGIPFDMLGEVPYGLPYSIWQLVEHIRIAQWDMLEFSRNADHRSPEWPAGYWSVKRSPANITEWENTLQQIDNDLQSFVTLIEANDLFRPIKHGEGQTILREALQIADHNAYHTAEIIIIRRLLGIWKS